MQKTKAHKQTKGVISLLMCLLLVLGTLTPSFSAIDLSLSASAESTPTLTSDNKLRVNADGSFKILQLADIQDYQKIDPKTVATIKLALAKADPDLVVLTGDNTFADSAAEMETVMTTIKGLLKDVPFVVTYGNHDKEYSIKSSSTFYTLKDLDELWTEGQHTYKNAIKLTNDIDTSDLPAYSKDDDSTVLYGTGYVNVYDASGTNVVNRVILLNSGTYEPIDEWKDISGNSIRCKMGYGRVGAKDYVSRGSSGTKWNSSDVVSGTTIHQDSTAAYNKVVEAVNRWVDENDNSINCIGYQHIPLREFTYGTTGDSTTTTKIIYETSDTSKIPGYDNGYYTNKKYFTASTDNATVTGKFRERVGQSGNTTWDLYCAFAKPNVIGLYYGHDHTNTIAGTQTIIDYDGNSTSNPNYGKHYTLTHGYGGSLDVSGYFGSAELGYDDVDLVPRCSCYTINGDGTWSRDILDYINLCTDNGTAVYPSDGSAKYIGEIALYASEEQAVLDGYTVVTKQVYINTDSDDKFEGNLTTGYAALSGGSDMFLCYKTTTNPSQAIRDVRVDYDDDGATPAENATKTYQLNGHTITYNYVGDANNVKHKYVYYTKDANAGAPIEDFYVATAAYNDKWWVPVDANLNLPEGEICDCIESFVQDSFAGKFVNFCGGEDGKTAASAKRTTYVFAKRYMQVIGNAAETSTTAYTLAVPETIYLNPSDNKSFQYSVNNVIDESTCEIELEKKATQTDMNLYFYCPNATRWTAQLEGLASGDFYTAASSADGFKNKNGFGSFTSYLTTDDKPVLETAVPTGTSKVLKWTISYTFDNNPDDANAKYYTTYAYSTVYAPYYYATGAVTDAKMSSVNNKITVSTWITGIQSVDDPDGTKDDGATVNPNTNESHKSMSPLLTINDPDKDGHYVTEPLLNLNNISENYKSTNNNILSNSDAPYLSRSFYYNDGNAGSCSESGAIGYITFDSSRIKNLNQIPNLYVGTEVLYGKLADDNKTGHLKAAYTVAETTYLGDSSFDWDNKVSTWKQMLVITDNNKTIDSNVTTKADSTVTVSGYKDLLRNKLNGTKTIKFFANPDVSVSASSSGKYLHLVSQSKVNDNTSAGAVSVLLTAVDKTTLRSAVQIAMNSGFQEENYTSDSWNKFKTKFEAAALALGKPNETQENVDTTANELLEAIAYLEKETVTVSTKAMSTSGRAFSAETKSNLAVASVTAKKSSITIPGYEFDKINLFNVNTFYSYDTSRTGTNVSSVSVENDVLTFISGNGTDNYTTNCATGSANYSKYIIPVEAGEEYTFSYTATGSSPRVLIFAINEDGKVPEYKEPYIKTCNDAGNKSFTYTIPAGISYVGFRFGNLVANTTNTYSNIKFYKSTKPTTVTVEHVKAKTLDYTFDYKPIDYAITYDSAGGSTPTGGTTSYNIETISITFPSVPTKDGYTFAGWKLEAKPTNGSGLTTGTIYTDSSISGLSSCYGSDITFTAQWTANTYTVTYNGNGSTGGSTASSTHIFDVAKALTSNGFSRVFTVTYNATANAGSCTTENGTATATFNGWATSADGNKVYNNSESVKNLSSTDGATVPLYAKWTDGNVTLPTASKAYDTTYHYTFDGWYTDKTGETKIGDADASYKPTANITIYAQFTPVAHSLTSSVTTQATCTTAGVTKYTCSCGYSYTQNIPDAAGHKWANAEKDGNNASTLKTAATCTADAIYYKVCSVCHVASTTETWTKGDTALGHTGGTANCLDKAVCTRCSTAYGEVNSANHKTVVNDAAVAATCTTDGKTAGQHCSACSTVITAQTTVPAKGHNYGSATYTWTKSGDTYTCTGERVCANDASHKITQAATVTKQNNPETCTADGSNVFTAIFTDTENFTTQTKTDTITTTGHSMTKTNAKAATCQATGNNEYWTCSRCNKVFKDENGNTQTTVSAETLGQLAHSYTGAVKDNGSGTHSLLCVNGCNQYGATADCSYNSSITTHATDSTNGVRTFTCSVCNHQYTVNTYIVKFMKDGEQVGEKQEIDENQSAVAPAENPEKTGYTFDGWDKAYNEITSNLTVNATWKPNQYNISYTGMENATYGTDKPTKYVYDTDAAVSNPTKAGYSFDGWKVNGDTATKNLTLAKESYTEDITLNATWSKINYTITYATEGNLGTYATTGYATSYNIESDDVTFGTPTLEGYTFDSWTLSGATFATGSVTSGKNAKIATGSYGNVTATAKFNVNQYTITKKFEDDKTTAEIINYNYGATVSALADPVRTGYKFKGWVYTKESDNSAIGSLPSTMPAYNIIATATWEAKTYTVTFNAKGGSYLSPATKTVTYDSTYGTLATVTPPQGQTFDGWYTAAENGTKIEATTKVEITENQTLYAHYTNNPVTINVTVKKQDTLGSYDSTTTTTNVTGKVNGDEFDFSDYLNDEEGCFNEPVVRVIKDGHIEDVTENKITGLVGGSTYEVEVTFTRKTHTVTVNYTVSGDNPSTAPEQKVETVYHGADVTVDSPSLTGYTASIASVSYTNVTEDKTENVTYQPNDYNVEIKYQYQDGSEAASTITGTVKYNANYSYKSPEIAGYTPSKAEVSGIVNGEINETVTYSAKGGIAYQVKHMKQKLDGAYEQADVDDLTGKTGEDATVTPKNYEGFETGTYTSEKIKGDGTTVIEVKYDRKQYKVTYEYTGTVPKGATALTAENTYKYGETVELTAVTAPEHYDFSGWTATGATIDNNKVVVGLSDIKLTGSFSLHAYNVTYVVNGVDENNSAIAGFTYTAATGNPDTYTYGTAITLNEPSKLGFTFNGWDNSGKIVATDDGDKTFTGTLQRDKYSITYHDDKAAENTNVTTYTVDDKVTLTALSKDGYTFNGWYTSEAYSGDAVTGFDAGQTGNKDYYAKWTINQYTVTAKAYSNTATNATTAAGYTTAANGNTVQVAGGTAAATSSKEMDYNSTYTLSATPAAGYELDGWYTTFDTANGTFSDEVSKSADITLGAADKTYYAKFSIKKYDVTASATNATVTGTGNFYYGQKVTLNAAANTGYEITKWNDGDGDSISKTVTVKESGNDYTVTATPISYAIAYVLGDGATATGNPENYTIESEKIELNNPTRAGYTFIGWTLTTAGQFASGSTVTGTSATIEKGSYGTVTATASWEANTVTITVNKDGSSLTDTDMDVRLYKADESKYDLAKTANAATYTGSVIEAGNYDVYAKNNDGNLADTGVDVEVTSTGTAEVDYYTLGLTKDDGIETVSGNGTYFKGQQIEINAVAKECYTFDKWTGDSTATTATTTVTMDTKKSCKATSNANVYSVTLDVNAETYMVANSATETVYEKYADGYYLENACTSKITDENKIIVPKRTGYTFKGYYTDKTAGTQYIDKDGKLTADASATNFKAAGKLYAQWEENTDTKYTVNHYQMNVYGTAYELLEKQDNLEGKTASELTLENLKKSYTGFTFKGGKAATATAVEPEKFDVTATILADGTTVINLYYSRDKYKLNFTGETGVASVSATANGTAINNGDEVYYGSAIVLTANAAGGYDTPTWDSEITTMPAAETTVKATATAIKYTATFVTNNGKWTGESTDNKTVEYYVTDTLSAPDTVTRDGYGFDSWKADTSVGNWSSNEKLATSSGKYGHVTFTAQWNYNTNTKYTIKYECDGVEVGTVEKTGTTEEIIVISTENYTATNGFVYEYVSHSGSTTISGDGNAVVTVKCKLVIFNLDVTLKGETTSKTITVNVGDKFSEVVEQLSANEKSYSAAEHTYAFDKWSVVDNNGNPLADNAPITTDTVIKALYKGDYTTFDALVEQANEITALDIKDDIKSDLNNKIAAGKNGDVPYDDENQATIDTAATALEVAINALYETGTEPKTLKRSIFNMYKVTFSYKKEKGAAGSKTINELIYGDDLTLPDDFVVTYEKDDTTYNFKQWTPNFTGKVDTKADVKYVASYDKIVEYKEYYEAANKAGTADLTEAAKANVNTIINGINEKKLSTGDTNNQNDVDTAKNSIETILSDPASYVSYTATFVAGKGNLTSAATATFTQIDDITLATATRKGYTLAGWKVTTAEGTWTTGDTVYTGTVEKGNTGNVTFTAQWDKNDSEKVGYTINHYITGTTDAIKVADTGSAPALTALSKETIKANVTGYEFSSAKLNNVAVDGNDITIEDDGAVIDLYYTATENGLQYTVYHICGEKTLKTETKNVTGGTTVTLENLKNNNLGCTYKEARVETSESEAVTQYKFINTGKTVYLYYEVKDPENKYTLTYDGNGTTSGVETEKTYDVLTDITFATAPTYEKHSFRGWMVTTANGNWVADKVYAAGETETEMFGNVTVTAQWVDYSSYEELINKLPYKNADEYPENIKQAIDDIDNGKSGNQNPYNTDTQDAVNGKVETLANAIAENTVTVTYKTNTNAETNEATTSTATIILPKGADEEKVNALIEADTTIAKTYRDGDNDCTVTSWSFNSKEMKAVENDVTETFVSANYGKDTDETGFNSAVAKATSIENSNNLTDEVLTTILTLEKAGYNGDDNWGRTNQGKVNEAEANLRAYLAGLVDEKGNVKEEYIKVNISAYDKAVKDYADKVDEKKEAGDVVLKSIEDAYTAATESVKDINKDTAKKVGETDNQQRLQTATDAINDLIAKLESGEGLKVRYDAYEAAVKAIDDAKKTLVKGQTVKSETLEEIAELEKEIEDMQKNSELAKIEKTLDGEVDNQKTIDEITEKLNKIAAGITDKTLDNAGYAGINEQLEKYYNLVNGVDVIKAVSDEIYDVEQALAVIKKAVDDGGTAAVYQTQVDALEEQVKNLLDKISINEEGKMVVNDDNRYADYTQLLELTNSEKIKAVTCDKEVLPSVQNNIQKIIKRAYTESGEKLTLANQSIVDKAKKDLDEYVDSLYSGDKIDKVYLKKYVIRYVNWDKTVLVFEKYVKGEVLTAFEESAREMAKRNNCIFVEWKEVDSAEIPLNKSGEAPEVDLEYYGITTYKAVFKLQSGTEINDNEYVVTFFKADNNTILEQKTVAANGSVEPASAPEKAADKTGHYVFTTWNTKLDKVENDLSAYPQYNTVAHNYEASFVWSDTEQYESVNASVKCDTCKYQIEKVVTHSGKNITRSTISAATCSAYSRNKAVSDFTLFEFTGNKADANTKFKTDEMQYSGKVYDKEKHVNIKEVSSVAPTCMVDGNYYYSYCDDCKKIITIKDKNGNAISHGELYINTDEGKAAVKWSDSTAHTWDGWIHESGDYATRHYRVCKNNPSHIDYDNCKGTVKSCTEDTYCDICHGAFIKAAGHKMVDVEKKAATCTTDGYEAYRKCSVCNYVDGTVTTIKALGHGKYNLNNTKSGSDEDGTYSWSCYECERNCGDYYILISIKAKDNEGNPISGADVTIIGNGVNVSGKTDGNGVFSPADKLKEGDYTVKISSYDADGDNATAEGKIRIGGGRISGSFGRVRVPGKFRCAMCPVNDKWRTVPVIGWIVMVVHFFFHYIHYIIYMLS